MSRRINSRRLLGAFVLLFCTGISADGLPSLSVMYFAGACPTGWNNASLESANGRTLLPTMLGGGSGSFIGEALTTQQEPKHIHSSATGSVSVTDRSYVLVSGCCNDSVGQSGTYGMHGSTETSKGGLPYIQYNACMKSGGPSEGSNVPTGLMAFRIIPQCDVGWSEVNSAAGRYIVGLPANGAPSASFGAKSLSPGEIRTHEHSMGGTIDLPRHNIAGASGCCASDYAASGNASFTGSTKVDTHNGTEKYDSAVQMPYYTATLCRKN